VGNRRGYCFAQLAHAWTVRAKDDEFVVSARRGFWVFTGIRIKTSIAGGDASHFGPKADSGSLAFDQIEIAPFAMESAMNWPSAPRRTLRWLSTPGDSHDYHNRNAEASFKERGLVAAAASTATLGGGAPAFAQNKPTERSQKRCPYQGKTPVHSTRKSIKGISEKGFS